MMQDLQDDGSDEVEAVPHYWRCLSLNRPVGRVYEEPIR